MKTFEEFCKEKHASVNQTYGGFPYELHLKGVVENVRKFRSLLNDIEVSVCECAAWGHDLIEDTRMTYHDVYQALMKYGAGNKRAESVTHVIYCCTEEKGRDRYMRHSDKFFKELSQNRLAVYVKLCDIAANITFSVLHGGSMGDRYKKEYPRVQKELYVVDEYDELWNHITLLLELV